METLEDVIKIINKIRQQNQLYTIKTTKGEFTDTLDGIRKWMKHALDDKDGYEIQQYNSNY